uniref:Glyco_hydro_85 n=1 Tax=uncultured Thermosipho sp. TaxID=481170 RepID=A0A060BZ04_9BACT|nr:Glyco_hydro_85 [uncultured Thermosipho sp.]
MIEMAKYYGFDGWFVNEEANGAFDQEQPVLKYEDMVDILNQFTEQAKKESEKTGDDIGIISYTNSGTLEYNNSSTPINNKSVLYARNSDGYLTDFGDNAYSNEKYSEAKWNKSGIR